MAKVERLIFVVLLLAVYCTCQSSSFHNGTLTNDSTTLNITGVTNRTLHGGWTFSCKWNYNFKILQVSISVVMILSGAFVLSLGYKKRRITFFLVGMISAAILTYFVCLGESNLSHTTLLLVSVAAGLFLSLFTTTVLYIGYFVTALFAGIFLGFGALLVFTTFQLFHSIAIPSVIIATISLVLVFATLWWRRVFLIISTSLLGAAMFCGGLDYFVEGFFILKYTEQKLFYSKIAPLCWYSYVVFGAWPALFVIGMLVQLLWTGKEKHKTNYVFIYRRRKRHREENIGLTSRSVDYI
eukprot:gene18893-20795_t